MTRSKKILSEKPKKKIETRKQPVNQTKKKSVSRKPVWYVYAIECNNTSVYIGQTRNLVQRWEQHCKGKGARWTRKYKPVKMFYAEKCSSFKQAWKRERELKKTKGRTFLKNLLKDTDLQSGQSVEEPSAQIGSDRKKFNTDPKKTRRSKGIMGPMKQKRILTLHPLGKKGVNISLDKYELIKFTIYSVLEKKKEATFAELLAAVRRKLEKKFDGSVNWYTTVVKLDLEARKIIESKRGHGLQQIHLRRRIQKTPPKQK